MAELMPAIFVFIGAYVTARILNHREYVKARNEHEKKEAARRNKIDSLYGREK